MIRTRSLLLWFLILLLWADLAVSLVGFQAGWPEVNPVGRLALVGGLPGLALLKAMASLVFVAIAYAMRPRLAVSWLVPVAVAYGLVVWWNVSVLLGAV